MADVNEWQTAIKLIVSNQDRLFTEYKELRKSDSDMSKDHSVCREEMLERMTALEQKTAGEFKNIYTRIGIITTIAAAIGATIPTIFFLINMYKNMGLPTGP